MDSRGYILDAQEQLNLELAHAVSKFILLNPLNLLIKAVSDKIEEFTVLFLLGLLILKIHSLDTLAHSINKT